jgi:hypothetical protein
VPKRAVTAHAVSQYSIRLGVDLMKARTLLERALGAATELSARNAREHYVMYVKKGKHSKTRFWRLPNGALALEVGRMIVTVVTETEPLLLSPKGKARQLLLDRQACLSSM